MEPRPRRGRGPLFLRNGEIRGHSAFKEWRDTRTFFLKNNGAEAPKVPRPIVFKEWRDTRTFSNLKSTYCTLLIVLIINLVTKKKSVYII
jgi:hypothetical protein